MQYRSYCTDFEIRVQIYVFLETIFLWIRGVLEKNFWLNKADFSEIVLHAGNIWLLYKGREWVTKIKQLSIAGHRK